MQAFLRVLLFLRVVRGVAAQALSKEGLDSSFVFPVSPRAPSIRSRLSLNCSSLVFRPLNGVCTSDDAPPYELFSSLNRPQFSYFAHHTSTRPTNTNYPSPRAISNLLSTESHPPHHDPRRLNMLATIFAQFVDHTLIATPQNLSEPFPIPVPADDPHLSAIRSLSFFRSNRIRVSPSSTLERPQNSLTSTLDLSTVYGPNHRRCAALRAWTRGRMRVSHGNLLPLNDHGVPNAPSAARSLFLGGDHRANEHPVLTALHTLFLREHNRLAAALQRGHPSWSDAQLFWNARDANIRQFQRIVYEEWLPAITGRSVGAYGGYKRDVEGGVSVEFAGAAFRVGHSMVAGEVGRVGRGGRRLVALRLRDVFFRSTGLLRAGGVEDFIRGAGRQRARRVDLEVDDALRNHLFRGVGGEMGFDLVAMNVQRCRDHGCGLYNELRGLVGLKRVERFEEISEDVGVREGLKRVYGRVERVEGWMGMLAEGHANGSSMGETMVRLWMREFERLRSADRWFYKRSREGSAVGAGAESLRELVLRNTQITASELPKRMFFVDDDAEE